MATTRTKAKLELEDLSPEARASLVDELREELRSTREPWAPGAEPRELTSREKAIRLLIRERDHLDGCPLIENEHRSAGRVEAYTEVKPANPATAEPAADKTVVRCIECGGSRVLDGDVRTNLIAALEDNPETASTDLDGAL